VRSILVQRFQSATDIGFFELDRCINQQPTLQQLTNESYNNM
jgi:hypothetical protein